MDEGGGVDKRGGVVDGVVSQGGWRGFFLERMESNSMLSFANSWQPRALG